MNLRFYVLFEGDTGYTEITDYIKYDSIEIEKAIFNDDFESVQDSISASTIYDETINAKFNEATDYMKAYVTSDEFTESEYGYSDGEYGYSDGDYGFNETGVIFTGAIYPNTEETITSYRDSGIDFEIVDNSYLLDVDCEEILYPEAIEDTCYLFNPNAKTYSVVHQILYKAGFTDDDINQDFEQLDEVDYIYVEEEDDTYLSILDSLLYEHHCTFYFDEDGVFNMYDWKHDSVTVDGEITNSDILDSDGITRTRNILDYDGYKITYATIAEKTNALLYRETYDEDDADLVLSGSYYPSDAESEDTYYSYSTEWLTDDADILNTYNHTLSYSDDSLTVYEETYDADEALVTLYNATGEDVYMYHLEIRGDTIYEDGEGEVKVNSDGTKYEEIECDYIHDSELATNLGEALYNNILLNGNYFYSFKSETKLELKAIKTLTTDDYTVNAIIYNRKYDPYTEKYSYTCIGIADSLVQTTTTKVTKISSTDNEVRSIDLTTNMSTISASLRTDGIVSGNPLLQVTLNNITNYTIEWTSSNSSTGADLIDTVTDLAKEYDVSLLEDDDVTISVTVVSNGVTYTDNVTMSKVYDTTETSMYLGSFDSTPTVDDLGFNVLVGDWFLYTGETDTDYTFGHLYEYISETWQETLDSSKVSASIFDGIEIAKSKNTTVYITNLYAEYLNAQDINITGKLSGFSDDGSQTFEINGETGKITAKGAEFEDCDVTGTFTSDEFSTQKEDTGTSYLAKTVSNTLWKESDIYDNFPVSAGRDLEDVTADYNGTTINKACKISSSNYVRFFNESENTITVTVSADSTSTLYTYTIPSTFTSSVKVKFKTTLNGYLNNQIVKVYDEEGGTIIYGTSKTSSTFEQELILEAGNHIEILGRSTAIWGSQTMTLNYFEVSSLDKYTGLIGFTSDQNFITILSDSDSKYHSINDYSITATSPSSFDSDNYASMKSGTEIISYYSTVPNTYTNVDGTVSATIDSDTITIDSMKLASNVLYIQDGTSDYNIVTFVDGTTTGVYNILTFDALTLLSQVNGIKTQNILPVADSSYDIGTDDNRFREVYVDEINSNSATIENINITGTLDVENELLIPTEYAKEKITHSTSCRGIAFDGEYYYLMQNLATSDYVDKVDSDFNIVSSVELTSNETSFTYSSITWANGNLIAYDPTNGLIVIFDGFSNTILSSKGISGSIVNPAVLYDITFDGTNLIMMGYDDVIYFADGTDVDILLKSIDVSSIGSNCHGLAYNNGYIYFFDTVTNLIYALNTNFDDNIIQITNFGIDIFSINEYCCLTFDNERLIVLPYKGTDIYKMYSRRLK